MIAERKTILLLLFVFLAVVLVGIVFWSFLSQKHTPAQEKFNERSDLKQVIVSPSAESVRATTTPGFKPYRNEEWGFEFEHPEDWKTIENPYGSPFSRFNLIIVPTEGKYLPDPVLVNIVTLDFADRAAISRKNLGAIESDVIIGGTSGIKYQYTEQFPTISIDLPFGKYRIILGAKTQYEDVFNRIIATFKFIEPDKRDAEPIKTETIVCNNENYVFDTVLDGARGYLNNIYKINRSRDNLLVTLKAPTTGLDAFMVLGVPPKNCNRIYLTTTRYETSRPIQGIFEWSIGQREARELSISKELWGSFIPSHRGDYWKDTVSSGGDKILVAHPYDLLTQRWSCDLRVLKLLNLQEDTHESLIQLSKEEALTSGDRADEEGYCRGLDFGWLSEGEIYYDVYDATTEGNRQLLGQRTLIIP